MTPPPTCAVKMFFNQIPIVPELLPRFSSSLRLHHDFLFLFGISYFYFPTISFIMRETPHPENIPHPQLRMFGSRINPLLRILSTEREHISPHTCQPHIHDYNHSLNTIPAEDAHTTVSYDDRSARLQPSNRAITSLQQSRAISEMQYQRPPARPPPFDSET